MIMDESMFYHGSRYLNEPQNCSNLADTLKSPEIQLLRIQALLAIIVSMLVFGLFRRRCGNWALALVASGANVLSPAIIAYTLGPIQSASFSSSYFPVWAAYLVEVLGSVHSYIVHIIEDNEQWKSFNLDSTAKCFMTSWMITSYVTQSMSTLCIVLLFIILLMKVDKRVWA
ncbi:hypothetical protein ACJRO7_017108 [Eucalyptus globulus]|uniref:DUF4220 domain-containing protein n=1 Tax=Eucalyptus globulus TaxID=34317 RepID=A0ABD3KP31_EUCGL